MNGLLIQPTVSAAAGLKGSAQSASASGKNNGMFSAILLAAAQGGGNGNEGNSLLSALAALVEGLQTSEFAEEEVSLHVSGQEEENDAFLALLASLLGGQELSLKQGQQTLGNGRELETLPNYQSILQLPKAINVEQLEKLVDRLFASGQGNASSISVMPEKESFAARIVQLLSPVTENAEHISLGSMKTEEQAALKLLALLKEAESGKVTLPVATKGKLEEAAALLINQHPLIGKALEGKRVPDRLFQAVKPMNMSLHSVTQNMQSIETNQRLETIENSGAAGTAASDTQKAAHFQYYPQVAQLQDVVGFKQSSEMSMFSVPLQDQSTTAPIVRAGEFAKHMATFMAQRMDWLSGNGTSEATIRLYPENLGQVDVKIVTQNGQVTAQFVTETMMGRELIESQLASLRAALSQQGLQVERLQVSYNPSTPLGGMAGESMFHQQQRSFREQQGSSNRTNYAVYGVGELEEETFLLPEMDGQATGIDYMA